MLNNVRENDLGGVDNGTSTTSHKIPRIEIKRLNFRIDRSTLFFAGFALIPKPGMAGGQQGGVVQQYPQSLMRKQLGTMHITGYCQNSDDFSAQGRFAAEFMTEYPEIGNLGSAGTIRKPG